MMTFWLLLAISLFYLVAQCQCTGTCKDLTLLTIATTIDQSVVKTYNGDVKGVVLRDITTKTQDLVYVVYIRQVCKDQGKLRFNCLFLKIFSSYEELKAMNSKLCWDKEIYIPHPCRLPTARISAGRIVCELEPKKPGKKPRIGLIDTSTGNLINEISLSAAKSTSNCLKSRDSKSPCSGTISDFNVHNLYERKSFYVLYKESTSDKYVIEDLTTKFRLVVGDIKSTDRALVICDKLYILSAYPGSNGNKQLRIVKSIDLKNPNNKMEYMVKLLENFPSDDWIHYNPSLQQVFSGNSRGDVTIYRVHTCEFAYPNVLTTVLAHVSSTFIWNFEPIEARHTTKVLDVITKALKITNIETLKSVSDLLVSCPAKTCNDIKTKEKKYYCKTRALISSLKIFSDYKQDSGNSRKRIQTHFHMDKLLEQQNFLELSDKMKILQDSVDGNSQALRTQMNSLRSDIGTYFKSLSEFNQRIATADFTELHAVYKEHTTKVSAISKIIDKKIFVLFQAAILSNFAELAGSLRTLTTASVAFTNPIESVSSGAESVLNLMEAIDKVSKVLVSTAKYGKLLSYFEELKQMGTTLNELIAIQIQEFANIRKIVSEGVKKILGDDDLKEYVDGFLAEYDKYQPLIHPSTITKYQASMEGIVNELCNIVYEGGTTESAIVQAIFASSGACYETKIDVQELASRYLDMASSEAGLITAYAEAVRATVAKFNSQRIQTAASNGNGFSNIQTEIRFTALEISVTSDIYRLLQIKKACQLIQYRSAGKMPGYCLSAIAHIRGSSYDMLIATKFNRDMCSDDKIEKIVDIPAMVKSSTSSLPGGTIDLTRLYQGKDVEFKIPDKQWLIDNKWLMKEDTDEMVVLQKMNLFLPMLQKNSNNVNPVTVLTSTRLAGENRIFPGGPIYDFNVDYNTYKFNFRYNQGQPGCTSTLSHDLPYQLPGCPKPPEICEVSNGEMEDMKNYPSIFAKWYLKASIQGDLVQPNPKGKFYLKALVTLCVVRPVKLVSVRSADGIQIRAKKRYLKVKKRSQSCCGSEQKYYAPSGTESDCKSCENGSEPSLHGYYCETA